jgi:hypothetical protein
MRLKWLLLGLFALLTACAAPGGRQMPENWKDQSNSGELVIYRSRSLVATVRDTYFYVDDVHVASLGSSSYSIVRLPPGMYRLTQKWDWDMMVKDMVIDVEVRPKQRSYVRLVQSGSNVIYSSPTVFQFGWELAVVPESIGSVEVQRLDVRPSLAAGSP